MRDDAGYFTFKAREDEMVHSRSANVLAGVSEPGTLHYAYADAMVMSACYGRQQPNVWAEHTHPEIQVTIACSRASATAEWHSAGGRRIVRQMRGPYVSIVSAGQSHGIDWYREADLVFFFISPSFLELLHSESCRQNRLELGEQYMIRDPLIEELGRAVRTEFLSNGPTRLLLESLGCVLTTHLLRTYATDSQPITIPKGGLAPFRLRQVLDHIEAHLGTGLSITELARVAAITPDHFRHSFRESMGLSPYQYVLQQRVEEAKRLLTQRHLSLAQISTELGFESQNHFTTTFQRLVGTTPKRFQNRS